MTKKLILKGKKILFVDDRLEVNQKYIRAVKENGGNVISQNTINKAINALLTVENIDFAVIDLHMKLPLPLPEEIAQFKHVFNSVTDTKMSLNTGQIIGMFINLKLNSGIRFIYLSAVAAHYQKLKNGEPYDENICYDKYDISPSQLVEIINQKLK